MIWIMFVIIIIALLVLSYFTFRAIDRIHSALLFIADPEKFFETIAKKQWDNVNIIICYEEDINREDIIWDISKLESENIAMVTYRGVLPMMERETIVKGTVFDLGNGEFFFVTQN